MNIEEQIKEYIADQTEPKRGEMQELHDRIVRIMPKAKLWFLDGKNSEGKVVTNPDIGYGSRDHKYADGSIREFLSDRHRQTNPGSPSISSVSKTRNT